MPVPAVTAVVAGVSAYTKEAHADRNRRSIGEQAFADANAQVAFASEWWNAQQLLGPEVPAGASDK
jgi:hypothetical protein